MGFEEWGAPLDPTPEMIEAGAKRLVIWEGDCIWPDSWSGAQVAAARTEAERVWRSMWAAFFRNPREDDE